MRKGNGKKHEGSCDFVIDTLGNGVYSLGEKNDNKVKIIYDNSINLGGLYRLISVYILIVHGIFPYFCPSIEMRVLNGR